MNYRQPILIFGIVIPMVVIVAIGIVIFKVHSGIKSAAAEKQDLYTQIRNLEMEQRQLDTQVAGYRNIVDAWKDVLASDANQTLGARIPQLLNQFPDDHLFRISSQETRSAGGLGTATQQPAARNTFTFIGAWTPMQQFLLQLETSLPQLQLESINISTEPGSQLLNYTLQYTAWNKAEP